MMAKTNQRNIITDKLVVEKTGKTMEQWFLHFEKKGAIKMTQKDIYDLANRTKGLEPLGEWNQNLLATSYAWSRGLKERGQKEDGFEISVSKTINVPLPLLYKSVIDDKSRTKWLTEKITIRKCTENKSARITWSDNETSLSVDFYKKAEDKAQIVMQHQKIKTGKDVEIKKKFWADKLNQLKAVLEE